MCLNSHSDIGTFGEFGSLRKRFARIKSGQRRGLCSFCYAKCEVIGAREANVLKWCYYSRFHKAAQIKAIFTHPLYVSYYARKMGVGAVCDTTKSVSWAKFVDRYCSWGLDFKYIFLFRDPRGVIAAHTRKQRDLGESIESYKNDANQILEFKEALTRSQGKSKFVEIRYEDFATNPRSVLTDVCACLGLDFQDCMLEYDQTEHHIIGGNDKARSRVKKNFEQAINYRKPDIDWYLGQRDPFFLDERWKTELGSAQRSTIEKELDVEMSRLGYTA